MGAKHIVSAARSGRIDEAEQRLERAVAAVAVHVERRLKGVGHDELS